MHYQHEVWKLSRCDDFSKHNRYNTTVFFSSCRSVSVDRHYCYVFAQDTHRSTKGECSILKGQLVTLPLASPSYRFAVGGILETINLRSTLNWMPLVNLTQYSEYYNTLRRQRCIGVNHLWIRHCIFWGIN